MTLAESRGIPKRGAERPDAEPPHERAHPSPSEYAMIGFVLAVVTSIEVAVFYADVAQWALVTILVVLSAFKFAVVVLWFMHLRFDSRLFSWLFVGGLVLASVLFVVVLATIGGGLT